METGTKSTAAPDELLTFNQLTKSFFGVCVLKGVSFGVRRGRIIGLIGENGAGKSTLMNVLGGNLAPDDGTMLFAGAEYAPGSPRDARAAGIGFVHQELNLFPNLSIAENLFITAFPKTGPLIRRAEMHRRTAELLKTVGLEMSADTLVDRLSSGERQLVEIAHALSFEAHLIILDEPTTSLTAPERERLFELMQRLRHGGRSFIFISHALGDVLRVCDDLVILRDGEVVGLGEANQFDQNRLISLMVGRELKQLYPTRQEQRPGIVASPQEAVALEALNLTEPGILRDVSFKLHSGEVLGLSGLMGAGRTELARILFGIDPCLKGTVMVSGEPLRGTLRGRIRRGLALLTESRREDGLCIEASVADNMALVTLPRQTKTRLRLLDFSGISGALTGIREAVHLQSSVSLEQPVRTLSGGNQQKVVLAKWLLAEPRVLILDEPTRGIDVGAKYEIYQLILGLAEKGAGILLISSEIEELMGLCDKICVLSRGQITAEFPRPEFDREKILRAAIAGHEREGGKA